jgi:2-polyprenyl-3-methyl-5-hydroxy-6-metoxy-1,4-benzoquinol methylase
MSAINMNDKVRDGYNVAAKAYSSVFRDQFKNNKHLDLLIEHLPEKASILDIGCGSGKPIDAYLVERGFSVIGIDISEEQIKLAKQNVPSADFRVADSRVCPNISSQLMLSFASMHYSMCLERLMLKFYTP